ncbi:hypothetical protein ACFXPZ_10770 [Streptomyces sp. NPDC059101]|uniref:hypothetical protein n=1 Tax=unclassified Streptomyces TaxID=2593676 RepID=UPI0036D14A1D
MCRELVLPRVRAFRDRGQGPAQALSGHRSGRPREALRLLCAVVTSQPSTPNVVMAAPGDGNGSRPGDGRTESSHQR